MRIAVIGWGSLIWQPKNLDVEATWFPDGPMLPIEFARVSGGKRLTLVLVDGAPLQQTLWNISRKVTLAEALRDLASREGTLESNIGCWPCTNTVGRFEERVTAVVAAWAQERRLDAVVWTALGPKKPNGENGLATDDELIKYLRDLEERGDGVAAREYVEKAPAQIKTLLRARICQSLGW